MFADAAQVAAEAGARLAGELVELRREWARVPAVGRARADATVRRIVDDLTAHPVCDASQVAARYDVSEVSARRALDQLARAGIVTEVSAARNHRIFEAHEVFSALDDIERDVRNRQPG